MRRHTRFADAFADAPVNSQQERKLGQHVQPWRQEVDVSRCAVIDEKAVHSSSTMLGPQQHDCHQEDEYGIGDTVMAILALCQTVEGLPVT
jgi:hypothetical protein